MAKSASAVTASARAAANAAPPRSAAQRPAGPDLTCPVALDGHQNWK